MTTTHYSPTPNATGPRWKRVAVCGVETHVGSEFHCGSSRVEHVDCVACLDIIDARKRIAEAGDRVKEEA